MLGDLLGSISKQFTAKALPWATEQGKLSSDDTVSRFLPELTRTDEVTIRQLLSHTSGYQVPNGVDSPATFQTPDGWYSL